MNPKPPNPTAQSGMRPAGLPSSAQQRAPAIMPSSPRSAPTTSAIPVPGQLKKAGSLYLTDDTEGFIVGDRVWVNGIKPGKIQFIGETKFAAGEWAGIVLDEPSGKNDGAVSGVRYFQCETNRGTFVRLHKLSRVALTNEEIEALKMQKLSAATSVASIVSAVEAEFKSPDSGIMEVNKSAEPSTSAAGGDVPNGEMKVGDRVWLSGDRAGTVQFIGKPHFQEGIWVGVELDEAKGKNDGSVEGKRYFTCAANHGVMAPIFKVTKSPPGAMVPPFTPGKLKRSPSQESLHSNFSVQSTASRRSIRLGTSSLSPATISVGRTGSGTAADIIKAHQEKDALIAALTRERDLAKKDLSSRLGSEMQTHTEIRKLQEQYMDALSNQDARIAEMSDSIKKLNSEKDELKEQVEDEKKKVEDLQFRLEEELMAKDAETELETKRLIERKSSEIDSLKEDLTRLNQEMESLRQLVQDKDLEVDRWKTSVDASKLEAADMVDERDRTSFEVADLRRQLRDLTEKYRGENEAFQQGMRSRDAVEQELILQLECAKAEVDDYRRKQTASPPSKLEENSNLQVIIDDLKRDNASQQVQLQELTNNLNGLREERNLIKSSCDILERSALDRRTALAALFQDVGQTTPESEKEETAALFSLFASVRSKEAAVSGDLQDQLTDAEKALAQIKDDYARLDSEREALRIHLCEATSKADDKEKNLLDLRTENERMRKSLNETAVRNEEELLENEKVLKDHIHEAKRMLEDKSREVETLAYQLSELSVELGTLKTTHQDLVHRTQSDLSNVDHSRQQEVDQLMQKHSFEIGVLKRDFELQSSALKDRLAAVESELQAALSEKVSLNGEIGRFLGVLNEKDADLKEAREQIERTIGDALNQHHEEKAKLGSELVQEKEKCMALEQQLASLTALLSEKNALFEEEAAALELKERDFVSLRATADELAQKCTKLEQDAEQTQSAYAEQMMRAEMRREEDTRVSTTEKNALVEKLVYLEEQVQMLTSTSSVETEAMRLKFVENVNQLQSTLAEKNGLLESAAQELSISKALNVSMDAEIARFKQTVEDGSDAYSAMKKELDALAQQRRELEDRIAAMSADKSSLAVVLEEKEKELHDLGNKLQLATERNEKLRKELDYTNDSFGHQLSVAQERSVELQQSVDTERNTLVERIKMLENQLSDVMAENAAKIGTEHSELRQKINGLETELAAKASAVLASGNDILFLKAEAQKSQHEVARLNDLLQESQQNLLEKTETFRQLDRDRTAADVKLRELERTTDQLKILEESLKQRSTTLEQANQAIATLEDERTALHAVIADLKSDLVSADELKVSLSDAKNELAVVTNAKKAAEERIKELEGLNDVVQSLETTVHDQSVRLVSSGLKLSSMESEIFQSHMTVNEVNTALTVAKEAIVRTEAERAKLESEKIELSGQLSNAEGKLVEIVGLRQQVTSLSQENASLKNDVDGMKERAAGSSDVVRKLEGELSALKKNAEREIAEMKQRELVQQNLIEQLENELLQARRHPVPPAAVEDSTQNIHSDSQRSIDDLLSKELERVQGEVDHHRRLIEQRDSEISRMRHQQQEIIDQKNSEISAFGKKVLDVESALRKEKLQKLALSTSASSTVSAGDNNEFQVQLLNSIISEQLSKIMDLEKKVKELTPKPSASGLADVPPAEPSVAPKRRPIRLYCAQCQVFDAHDSADCPKHDVSPERQSKPKVPRVRRKFCEECDMFDQHDTTECPKPSQKNPPRVPHKPTGLVPLK